MVKIPRYLHSSMLKGCRSLSSLLVFTLATLPPLRQAVVIPPYHQENFDPALALPEFGVSCVGQVADLQETLPPGVGWDPNTVSMQSLCVKPQYGGGPEYQHLGAYCYSVRDGLTSAFFANGFNDAYGVIAFDKSPQAHAATWLQNPRILFQCRMRCFCDRLVPLEDRSVQPPGLSWFYRTGIGPLRNAYQFAIDDLDDYVAPTASHIITTQGPRLYTEIITGTSEVAHRNQRVMVPHEKITMVRQNTIDCQGPLPDWSLPGSTQRTDYIGLKELCAVQLSGGRPAANAGGYCHRNPPGSRNPNPEVWFSDAFTPRVEWTWDNFLASAAIRFHCRRYCRCSLADPGLPGNRTQPLWQFLAGWQLVQKRNGATQLQRTGHDQSVMEVLPPQSGAGPSAGGCGPDGKQFCPTPWPKDLLGPIPRVPPGSNFTVSPVFRTDASESDVIGTPDPTFSDSATSPNVAFNDSQTLDALGTCGGRCTNVKDCGPGDSDTACTCRIPNWVEIIKAGLDPVFPLAICFTVAKQMAAAHHSRDIGNVSMESAPCPCNATYISHGCCSSSDGMIWEDEGQKLGRLVETL
ncbi:MAG: hypothetical protein M1817_001439 [Caeruleum heppii]|nr:MAG: hypothetical protein M1817_001439 [Caeruleum heppii]